MESKKIGIGFVGLSAQRGWAALAHIPALRKLPAFEIRGLAASSPESAKAAAEKFGVPYATDSAAELARRPEIDLMVVAVKVTEHKPVVDAALNAGKHVLCEWPLGKDLAEAQAMTALAHAKNVRGFVNLQGRFHPGLMYVRDLVREGYVGDIHSTTIFGLGGGGRQRWPQATAYALDRRNGGGMINIGLTHTIDALCSLFGELHAVQSHLLVKRSSVVIDETDEIAPVTAADLVSLSGVLEGGVLASLSYRSTSYGTGLHWEINGDRGALLITAPHGNVQLAPLKIFGAQGEQREFVELPIPSNYAFADLSIIGASAPVGHMYEALAADLMTGSGTVASFDHAVTRQRLVAEMERAASG